MNQAEQASIHKLTITIVMPVYDVATYVERSLLSVMHQTRPADECLIVDDASPDESIAKCEHLIAKYNGPTRFKILHHKERKGLSAARNTGTDAATCDYIFYFDSDDELTSDCLEKLSEPLLSDNSIEMVMGNNIKDCSEQPWAWWQQIRCFPTNKWPEDTPTELHTNAEVLHWYYKGKTWKPPYVWNKLLKLEFVRNHQLYNREGLLFEDSLWNYQLLHNISHVVFVRDITYIYHIRPGSIVTATKHADMVQHRGVFYKELAKSIVPGERIDEVAYYYRHFCDYYVDAHNMPNYQYAYSVFSRELSDGRHKKMLFVLSLSHHLGKNIVGRLLFKCLTNIHRFFLLIYRHIC